VGYYCTVIQKAEARGRASNFRYSTVETVSVCVCVCVCVCVQIPISSITCSCRAVKLLNNRRSKLVQVVTLVTLIFEVHDSNIGKDSDYSGWIFSWFASVHRGKYWIFFLWCYSPNLCLSLPPLNSPFHFGFLDFGQSVGLPGRVISSLQDLYLYTNTEKRTHIH
jgi:hypothetical protein